MNALGIVLIVAAVVAVIAIAGYFHHRRERERRAALAAFAAQHGLSFSYDRGTLPGRMTEMADFARGHTRYAYNTMDGPLPLGDALPRGTSLPLQAGDYHYAVTRSNGKSSSTHHYHLSYVAVRCGRPTTPRVTLRREHFFDTISSALGFNDIDFESAEFSRTFHVSSEDKRFAYDLLHPRAIELLLKESPNRLDLRGEWLCITDRDRRWEPEEFARWGNWLSQFVSLWPSHLDALAGDLARGSTQEVNEWKG